MVTADLCRDVALEAVRRGARANIHELWALVEHLDAADPGLIVDIGSTPAEWWAWWSVCPNVIAVTATPVEITPGFSGDRLPVGVTVLEGNPLDAVTALRVADQIARRPVDVLVIGAAVSAGAARLLFSTYARHVPKGGRVLIHGIANPATEHMGRVWRDFADDDRIELIGAESPDGYGIVTIPRKVSSNG